MIAPSASASPGDQLNSWAVRPEDAHRNVAVADSGRVFVDALSESGYKPVSYLEHGYENDWVRTETGPSTWSGLATGPDNYAVNVRVTVDGPASYRVHDGDTWTDSSTFYDGPVHRAYIDANSDGDVSVLLQLRPDGGMILARLLQSGEWTFVELPSGPIPLRAADLVLNEQGKTTVVWAIPFEGTSIINRWIVREGSDRPAQSNRVITVNGTRVPLSIVSDGAGRETIIAGNQLWRQPHTSTPHEYRMRTSIHAGLAAGESATRVAWPILTETGYAIRTLLFDDVADRRQHVIWSHPVTPTRCHAGSGLDNLALGIGMVPGGRSYVAVGIRRGSETSGTCRSITALLVVNRTDQVLNYQSIGDFSNGDEFQVAAGAAGPIAVEFKSWDDHADPMGEDQPDGRYSLVFFQR
ncbi:hypothetical protein AB1046_21870 [Promicromonospora sp. Populi]|uniref:hypothetical protein n=1 Tax=Promicromonospora sp. Populi TaxID=3239420 RepID=UPI0034E207A6